MASIHPKDIATVKSADNTYVFYINENQQLCYITDFTEGCVRGWTSKIIQVGYQRPKIKCDSRQVAAVAWTDSHKNEQIRVYCIAVDDNDKQKRGYLDEICLEGENAKWYQGLLGSPECRRYVDDGSSLSATVQGDTGLKVFVWGKNQQGASNMDIHSYVQKGNWEVESHTI